MNKERFEELIEKYEQGESTLLEEKIISSNTENANNNFRAWFKFVQHNKKNVPEDLQDSIWESIQKKRTVTRRLRFGVMSAAASILLIISVAVFSPFDNIQSYKKKEALLNEALSMFEENKMEVRPVYEDDMIIIYASAE